MAVQLFTDTISTTIDDSTHSISKSLDFEDDTDLKLFLLVKSRARKRWQHFGDTQAKSAFYRYQRTIRRRRQTYITKSFEDKIHNASSNSKDFWSLTKRLLHKNSTNKNTHIQDFNGEMI